MCIDNAVTLQEFKIQPETYHSYNRIYCWCKGESVLAKVNKGHRLTSR